MTLWNKYTFVCPDCDTLVEATAHKRVYRDECLTCPSTLVLLSVVDATIPNTPTEKEEQTMETTISATITDMYNPNLLVTYKKITNGETEYKTEKVTDIEWLLENSRKNNDRNIEMNNKVFKLENVLTTYAQDADEYTLEVIREVADIFNIELTKEIEITGTMTFSATITVPLTEDYDLESLAQDALQVSSWGGDVDVSDYSVEDVREAY
jgi:hypothetical protein